MLALIPKPAIDENTDNMNQAIERVHTISVTYAVRDSFFDNMEIKQGDYLAMLENQLLAANPDFNELRKAVTDTIKGFAPEFVTVFYGCDADESAAEELPPKSKSCPTPKSHGKRATAVYYSYFIENSIML